MVDPGLTKIAEWIYYILIPQIRSFFSNMFASTIFDTMSTEELQILCITIALHALLLAVLLKIGEAIARRTGKKRKRKTPAPSSKFKPKKWSDTGWYWDEKKGVWVPPDYLSEESKKRWKWDEEKRIWIEQNPQ